MPPPSPAIRCGSDNHYGLGLTHNSTNCAVLASQYIQIEIWRKELVHLVFCHAAHFRDRFPKEKMGFNILASHGTGESRRQTAGVCIFNRLLKNKTPKALSFALLNDSGICLHLLPNPICHQFATSWCRFEENKEAVWMNFWMLLRSIAIAYPLQSSALPQAAQFLCFCILKGKKIETSRDLKSRCPLMFKYFKKILAGEGVGWKGAGPVEFSSNGSSAPCWTSWGFLVLCQLNSWQSSETPLQGCFLYLGKEIKVPFSWEVAAGCPVQSGCRSSHFGAMAATHIRQPRIEL